MIVTVLRDRLVPSPESKRARRDSDGNLIQARGAVLALEIGEALDRAWPTDVHLTAYAPCRLPPNDLPVRLARGSLDAGLGPTMVLAIGDCDDPIAHAESLAESRAEWRADVEPRLTATGLAWYWTRRGARVVGLLAEPFAVRTAEDWSVWTARYVAWCDAVEAEHGLVLDRACADPVHLFRAPNVRRDGRNERADVQGGERLIVRLPETAAQAPRTPAAPRLVGEAEISDADLEAAVAELAGEYVPGNRHALGKAVAGYCRNAGLSQASAELLLTRLAEETGSDLDAAMARVDWAYRDDVTPPGASWLRAELPHVLTALDDLDLGSRRASVEHFKRGQARREAPAFANEDASTDAEVDAVIAHLADERYGLFQRAGTLCEIIHDAEHTPDGLEVRPKGAPSIKVVAQARLREVIGQAASRDQRSLAPTILARGQWHSVRPLDGIAAFPVLRPDGTVLLDSGYDWQTRTMAEIGLRVVVPPEPSQGEARAALRALRELVCDFPFADEAAASAWLAMLLTVLARPAIDGPTPLGLLDASTRGAGKTLLADLVATLATGKRAPRRTAPKTREEWDKAMLAWLLAGDPIILIDNITGTLASDALDLVLTGTHFTQRILGVSEQSRVAVRAVFLASSNNARVSTDLVRRAISCRLVPEEERPETRTGFAHPRLLAHAAEHRAGYLAAALTILRAYAVAGRPAVQSRAVGSFESWGEVVRDALVWAGADDPVATQDALRESADVEGDVTRDLLVAWHALLGDTPVTARQLLDAAQGRDPTGAFGRTTPESAALLDAISGLLPGGAQPTTAAVGYRLRGLRDTIVGGLRLLVGERCARDHAAAYRVIQV